MVPVPSPLSVNANVGGRLPERLRAGVGEPSVVTVKENGSPVMAVAEAALVNEGATPPSSAKADELERPLSVRRPAPRAKADTTTSQRLSGRTITAPA